MRRHWILTVFTLLVLAGAAGFLLAQSTTPPIAVNAQKPVDQPKAEKVLEIAVEKNINGEITSGQVQVRFEDPETLPAEGESAFGVFLEQDGEVITLPPACVTVSPANIRAISSTRALASKGTTRLSVSSSSNRTIRWR